MRLNKKQKEVLECIKTENPKFLLCCGAKRAGKTFILNLAMLGKIAEHEGENKVFILGGYSYSSIWRNVLNDWENILNKKIKIAKDGHFKVFGNKVYIFNGSNVSSWKDVRGFTAQGAFLNEATALHESFVREVMSRCSESGSFVYMDTNPEGPQHYVCKEFYEKSGERLSSGKLNKQAFEFTLDDNDSLDPEYIESIKLSTPPGFYYDRDILGKWVNAEGLIYKMFDNSCICDPPENTEFKARFVGVDWGFGEGHAGALVTCGLGWDNNFYVLDEVVAEHKHVEWWIQKARSINRKYGNLHYFADHARPEPIDKFALNGMSIHLAKKDVQDGIELISLLMHNHRVFISPSCKRILEELSIYTWGLDGKPVKKHDDSLDALRYAIYSFYRYYPRLCNFVKKLDLGGSDEDME